MAAYYNENDPKAAAWLRELIKVRGRVLQACSSFDLIDGDTLDKAPRSSTAKQDSYWHAERRSVDIQACEQSQLHEIPHKLRKLSVRLDSADRSEHYYCRGVALPSFAHGRQLQPVVGAYETRALISHCWHVGIHQSKATCLPVLIQGETIYRRRGSYDHRKVFRSDSSFSSAPCTCPNSISCEYEQRPYSSCIQRIST